EEPVVRVTANAPSIAATPAYTIDALPKAPAAMAVAAPRTEAAQTSGDVSPRAVRIVTATAAITDRAYVRTAGFISPPSRPRTGRRPVIGRRGRSARRRPRMRPLSPVVSGRTASPPAPAPTDPWPARHGYPPSPGGTAPGLSRPPRCRSPSLAGFGWRRSPSHRRVATVPPRDSVAAGRETGTRRSS